ncbi:Hpt protein [Breoghania corrubedonensis]|uniref:Hpt protein n=1 Tax=Breoghania corrubedonensis TaxID=665038 RepID=A0A2T5VCZ1_9HYPH|nr:Hpt domain-containing protein [Breoghania corrubedonensis]PTW61623.1 Hpt protein [Breoghania corrubedonensis]
MNDRAADGDFEIITPPVNLRSKVRKLSRREEANFDPVAAAEAALAKLSTNFNSWMEQETESLRVTWVDIEENGLDEERRDTLFRHSHDIKGQAATLGYPLAGHIADSLCHLLETVQDVALVPERLIEQHIQAIRAIVAEDARDEADLIANALVKQLTDVTADYISSIEADLPPRADLEDD